jgi:hypothetical protein
MNVVTPSHFRTGWTPENCKHAYSSGAPFPFKPVRDVHRQTVKCCYCVHLVRIQSEPIQQHFSERSENGFGVMGVWDHPSTRSPTWQPPLYQTTPPEDHPSNQTTLPDPSLLRVRVDMSYISPHNLGLRVRVDLLQVAHARYLVNSKQHAKQTRQNSVVVNEMVGYLIIGFRHLEFKFDLYIPMIKVNNPHIISNLSTTNNLWL